MMFLLRTALWTSLVLALLPSLVPSHSPPVAVDIAAEQALSAASETIVDLGGLCERRPAACAAGAQFAAAFWHRVEAGAIIVYDFVGGQLASVDRMHAPTGSPFGGSRAAAGGGAPGTAAGGASAGAAADAAGAAGTAGAVAAGAPRPDSTKENAFAAPDTLSAGDLIPAWRGPPRRRDGKHPA